MSILKKLPESGCLIYGIFLLWMGILLGIPGIIWDESAVNGSGIAGLAAAMIIPVLLEQFKLRFVRDYPLTVIHLCYTFAYCIAMTIYVIGGEDAELFVSAMFGIVALLVSVIIDSVFYEKEQCQNKQAKKCREGFKVGDKFSIREHKPSSDGSIMYHLSYEYEIISISYVSVIYVDKDGNRYSELYDNFIKMTQQNNFSWNEN